MLPQLPIGLHEGSPSFFPVTRICLNARLWPGRDSKLSEGPSRCRLDTFAHGDVLAQPLEFLAVGGALGFCGSEGLGGMRLAAAILLQLFHARRESDERVGERV